jgi:hypothetical protein
MLRGMFGEVGVRGLPHQRFYLLGDLPCCDEGSVFGKPDLDV